MDNYMPIEADTVAEMKKMLQADRSSHKLIDQVAKSFVARDQFNSNSILPASRRSAKASASGHGRGLGPQQSVVTESVLGSNMRVHETLHNLVTRRTGAISPHSSREPSVRD